MIIIRTILKFFGLLFFGLFTATILYPVLHESGHSIASIFCGAKVLEYHLFPLPNILCDISGIGTFGLFIIGSAGSMLPLAISLFVNPKGFWLSYMNVLLVGICALSFAISGIGLLFSVDVLNAQDDFVKIASIIPYGKWILLLIGFSGLLTSIIKLAKSKFVYKLKIFFDI